MKRYVYPSDHNSIIYNSQTWKQPKCPQTDEWIRIKKMWYIYTMEYYSAIKRNKIGSFVDPMDLHWVDVDVDGPRECHTE